MKTVADLKKLREQLQSENQLRHATGTQVIVGMGTCGIAAGAREVLSAVLDEIAKRGVKDVNVTQTGGIGLCEQEVLVDVVRSGEPRISYGKVTPDFVARIIEEHVVNGRILDERVVGKITK